MKKILILILALACLLGMVGCDPGSDRFDEAELLENTVRIELYHYENEKPVLLREGDKTAPVFDFNKATLIAELDKSRIEDVVKDIAMYDLMLFGRTLNEPIGKTLILHQRSGDMIVFFGCVYKQTFRLPRYYGFCLVFDENGNFVEYMGDIGSSYVEYLESTYFESGT